VTVAGVDLPCGQGSIRRHQLSRRTAFRSRSMCARGVTGAPSRPRRSLSTATHLPQYGWPAAPQARTPPGGSTGCRARWRRPPHAARMCYRLPSSSSKTRDDKSGRVVPFAVD
jgi:hypothetical protein